MRHAFTTLAVLAIVTLTACNTMRARVADFDLEGSLSTQSLSGEPVASRLLSTSFKNPQKLSPYSDLFYDGPLLRADFSVNSDFLRFSLSNKSNEQIKFCFNEAELITPFKTSGSKLAVYSSVIAGKVVYSDPVIKGQTKTAPALFLDAHQKSTIAMSPDYSGVFPSKKIFNIRLDENELYYLDNSTSPNLELRIPIEYEGKREMLVLKFSPTAINTRISYR
ncbi:hypothetical protein [Undibacterium rugosum]|uniref:hypothetical protein n=1 Tax=Undibacterium rugosum TaxID=2762291 RepID=UPI001B8172AC|nr:hypothetical protein [Undibacterium rugosum]MBR7779414.1 hypothetical protein [Undibacterium rugosum]